MLVLLMAWNCKQPLQGLQWHALSKFHENRPLVQKLSGRAHISRWFRKPLFSNKPSRHIKQRELIYVSVPWRKVDTSPTFMTRNYKQCLKWAVYAGIPYRKFFLFLNFIPALSIYTRSKYIYLFFIFLTVYNCFAFKKYTGTSKISISGIDYKSNRLDCSLVLEELRVSIRRCRWRQWETQIDLRSSYMGDVTQKCD
jgi:hypothetical protein